MSETKRTKAASTRRAAKGAAVDVLEQEPPLVSALDGIDGLDDILGEIAPPPKAEPVDDLVGFDDILSELAEPAATEPVDPLDDILSELAEPPTPAPVDDFDDILSEIVEPAKAEPVTGLDDILDEIAEPAKAEPVAGFDDILSEIAGPAKVEPVADFDDILSEISGPAKADAGPSLDDILGEVAGPAVATAAAESSETKAPRKRAAPPRPAEEDDLSALLDEMTPVAPVAPAAPATAEIAPAEPAKARGMEGKAAKLVPSLRGKREISRKRYVGLVGTVGLLAVTTLGQAAFILMRPAAAPAPHAAAAHGAQPAAPAIPLVPVDYSKIDLTRYRDKVRALGEGGRDMLRNPAIKEAILQLDNGEQLYEELRNLSRLSKAADLVSIANDRLTINSCNLTACADKSFKLVYDLQHESATVCMTEKYLNGSYLSYSYSPEGYREEPGCNGGANPVPVAAPAPHEPADDHASLPAEEEVH